MQSIKDKWGVESEQKQEVLVRQQSMFCNKCGVQLLCSASFCHGCGSSVSQDQNAVAFNSHSPAQSIGRVVLTAVVCIVALIALFGGMSKSDSPSPLSSSSGYEPMPKARVEVDLYGDNLKGAQLNCAPTGSDTVLRCTLHAPQNSTYLEGYRFSVSADKVVGSDRHLVSLTGGFADIPNLYSNGYAEFDLHIPADAEYVSLSYH